MKICSKCRRELSEDCFSPNGGKYLRSSCKECSAARTAALHAVNRAAGRCLDCKSQVDAGHTLCPDCRERRKGWYHSRYHDRELKNSKERRQALKLAALDAYGGPVCKCCGETHIEFLSIDHLNNDGSRHRKEIKNNGGQKFYEWLKKNCYPPGFQVLCMNCNFAKGHFKACPHERERPTLAAVR